MRSAYAKVKENEKVLELSRTSLKEAHESLRLILSRYENSLSPVIDLLDAQAAVARARMDLTGAVNAYDYSLAELYSQSGILLQGIEGSSRSRIK